MNLTSKILELEKSIIAVETSDAYPTKKHFIEEVINIKKDKIGKITSSNTINDGVVIIDAQMYFYTPQTIQFEAFEEYIFMSFIGNGIIKEIKTNRETENIFIENTHNISYTPSFKKQFEIPALKKIDCFLIVLSVDFYAKLICENWNLHQEFSDGISLKKAIQLNSKHLALTPEIQWIIHEIKTCSKKGIIKKMYLETKIKELLILQLETLLHQPQENIEIKTEDYAKLLEAKMILENNFTNAPTLSELSRRISLNEFKLKKGFKACFETTVKGYVIKLRMEYAKKLFKNKASNVGEVAYKCGYKDASHFSAAFKLFYGFTPVSFRKSTSDVKFHLLFLGLEDMLSFLFFN